MCVCVCVSATTGTVVCFSSALADINVLILIPAQTVYTYTLEDLFVATDTLADVYLRVFAPPPCENTLLKKGAGRGRMARGSTRKGEKKNIRGKKTRKRRRKMEKIARELRRVLDRRGGNRG